MIAGQDQKPKKEKEEEKAPSARANPVLRKYFHDQYVDAFWTGKENRFPAFADRFVDRQIDFLLTRIDKEMSRIKKSFAAARKARSAFLEPQATLKRRNQARQQWKEQLKELSDAAGDLHGTLSSVLAEMESKDNHLPPLQKREDPTFRAPMRFLDSEIRLSQQRINEFFIEPTHVVNLQELEGDNMLIHLYHVDKMARKIRDAL